MRSIITENSSMDNSQATEDQIIESILLQATSYALRLGRAVAYFSIAYLLIGSVPSPPDGYLAIAAAIGLLGIGMTTEKIARLAIIFLLFLALFPAEISKSTRLILKSYFDSKATTQATANTEAPKP